ncbi:MAG TPA: hypothetical protein VNM90_26755 [Haliangium sp.]|nr:hypothetical protein [Haliangium sp.]
MALSLWLPGSARAQTLKQVPSLDGKAQPLTMRVVAYDGSTNGRMVVEVVNNGKQAETFIADGIYFVPGGNPEVAPQRLGAAGPIIMVEDGAEKTYLEGIQIPPGSRQTVSLEVFCIDSHRSSPSSETKFGFAAKRLPRELRQQITHGAKRIIHENQGDVAKAKPAIQSHMWETRDADWIKLDGERKQEKAPGTRHQQMQRQQLRNAPRNHEEQQFAQPPQ